MNSLNHPETYTAVLCERAFLAALDGSCRTPIAGHAYSTDDGKLSFRGLIAHPDGIEMYNVDRVGSFTDEDAIKVGQDAGQELKSEVGAKLLDFLNSDDDQFNPNAAPTK